MASFNVYTVNDGLLCRFVIEFLLRLMACIYFVVSAFLYSSW